MAAELREAEALQAESDARVAELEGSVSELKAQERAMIRGKLLMDAQTVWGSVSGTAASAEPTVFRLTGMSAEDVKQVASEVSQELMGADERAWLERSGRCSRSSVYR